MANVKISQMPAAANPGAATDTIPILRAGVNDKATMSQYQNTVFDTFGAAAAAAAASDPVGSAAAVQAGLNGGATGEVLTKDSNADGDYSWQAAGGGGSAPDNTTIHLDGASKLAAYPTFRSYVAGLWYWANEVAAIGNRLVAVGTIKFIPVYFDGAITINNIGCLISNGSATGNIQFGVYATDPATGRPTGAPLATSANISTTTPGLISAAITLVIPTRGIYWIGVNGDINAVTCQLVGGTSAGSFNNSLYVGALAQANLAASLTAIITAYTTVSAFGTWPSTPTLVEATSSFSLNFLVNFSIASVP